MNWQRKKDQVERKRVRKNRELMHQSFFRPFKGDNYGKILVKITLSFFRKNIRLLLLA
jgi:hypothetical protein